MGSLRLGLVIILAIHFYKVNGDVPPLRRLKDNKLSVGPDRDLPNATEIDCGKDRVVVDFKRTQTLQLSKALTESYFGTSGFYCRPLTAAATESFRVAEVKHTFGSFIKNTVTAYVIHKDDTGERAHWLPQGQGYIDIPQTPNADEPKFVFTMEFSGCSWTFTPRSNGKLRIRHVTGGNETKEFNDLSEEEKGGPISYAMQFKDYGYVGPMDKLVKSSIAFAYMHFSKGSWKLYIQRHTCAPRPGNWGHGSLEAIKMKYDLQNTYKAITSTSVYKIPAYSQ